MQSHFTSAQNFIGHRSKRRFRKIFGALHGATLGCVPGQRKTTAALAADKAYEFLFVLGQPRWRGGVQAVINPIAIR